MIIQIYAFTRSDEINQALSAGVDHIGFVVGDYGVVHGELNFSSAANLIKLVKPPAKSVALTMSTDTDEILRMADEVRADIVHISSEPESVGISQLTELRRKLNPKVKLMKAIAIIDNKSIENAMRFAEIADILLLDTKIGNLPGVGATGKTHDWNISREIVAHSPVPVILAGGLSPENVASAIQTVRPWGVDSNTATNLPGSTFLKDINLIRGFVKAVRPNQNGETSEKG